MEDNGCYFVPVGKRERASKKGRDGELARRLWEWTEERLGEWGF
jgi:hypothetical protein